MPVLDASVAVPACRVAGGFDRLGADLVAPPLLRSEARSVLHRAVWRGLLPREQGEAALERLERAPVELRTHPRLGLEAWRIADALGWAKAYDAEYLALATLLRRPLATLDGRLARAASRLGIEVVAI
ncbi:MAG: type II toxin-antitoxin system VapC family toxin [Thermoleophilia bacterium]|nr:type II toxin-antitoxin system VapC family toxin [Thermoleophilia bacterium]